MLIFKMTLISLFVVGTSSQLLTAYIQSPCHAWCQLPCVYPWQTPQYCCDTHVKPGRCPPVRVVCPRSHPATEAGSISSPLPVACQSDSECSGTEKCCYDRCLMYYTCKPAE